jgi:hypothetical protein
MNYDLRFTIYDWRKLALEIVTGGRASSRALICTACREVFGLARTLALPEALSLLARAAFGVRGIPALCYVQSGGMRRTPNASRLNHPFMSRTATWTLAWFVVALLTMGLPTMAADSSPGRASVPASPDSAVSTKDVRAREDARPPEAAAVSSVPKIQFDSINFDFGKVKSGEAVKHDFIFTNTGAATLEILEVKPGCGCTTAGDWDKRVEPGKTGKIPLEFHTAAYSGLVAKAAMVNCNDASQTNMTLILRGTVWKPIDAVPAMAFFYVSSETASNEMRAVRLVSNLDQPVTVSDLQCTNEAFRAEVKTVTPGKEFELCITAVPPFTNTSAFAVVTLKTSAPEAPSLSVNAYLQVQPAVSVAPAQITLPATGIGSNFTSLVQVRNNGTNALELSDARVDPPEIQLRLLEQEHGRQFNLVLAIPPGFQIPPGKKAAVTVKSNHPKFPLLSVPIIQLPPPVSTAAAQPAAAPVMARAPAPAPGTRIIPTRILTPISAAK